MSPLEIHCLLEIYALGSPTNDGNYQQKMAHDTLEDNGLIRKQNQPGGGYLYKITAKGQAHVDNLCDLHFPVKETRWVMPEGTRT